MVEYRLKSNEIVTVTLEIVTSYLTFTSIFPVSIQKLIRITSHSGQNVGLGEGSVGSIPETYNNPKRPPSQLYFGVIGGDFSTLEP